MDERTHAHTHVSLDAHCLVRMHTMFILFMMSLSSSPRTVTHKTKHTHEMSESQFVHTENMFEIRDLCHFCFPHERKRKRFFQLVHIFIMYYMYVCIKT